MNRLESFVPYIQDFEKEVEDFLKYYGYEELIENPAPVPIKDIIQKKMSLNIVDSEYLSPNYDVQGIISFSSGIVEIYDWLESEYVGYRVDGPTILIDASYKNIGYINRILAHEAYHWYRHRAYFIYKSTHNDLDEFAFRCTKSNAYQQVEWSNQQKMEWQAKKIAPMLLLPKKSVTKKIKELTGFDVNEYSLDVYDEEQLIKKLSLFYGVTEYTIQERLRSLGYNITVNENKISNELFPRKNIHNDKTLDTSKINLVEGFREFANNEVFRKYLESGLFTFSDDSFIYCGINNKGKLLFSQKLVPLNSNDNFELMFRKTEKYEERKVFSKQPQNLDYYAEVENHTQMFLNQHERLKKRYKTANEIICEYMDDAKWNTAIFQEKTLLSPMDYTRVRQPDHTFKLPHYVAIAVGLKLSLQEFNLILDAAGLKLVAGNIEHDAYSYILSVLQGRDIDFCNDFLKKCNIKRLGTKQREWSDSEYGGKS